MHKVIELFFVNHNYEEIEVNIEELKVYIKDRILYCVIDFNNESIINGKQFDTTMNQLYEGVISAGKNIDKSVIFACGEDGHSIIEMYTEKMVNGKKEYKIEEALVLLDTVNRRIVQDSNAFEECHSISQEISEYINNYGSKVVEQGNNVLDTKQAIREMLKKTCTHIAVINILIFVIMFFLNSEVYKSVMQEYSLNWRNVVEDDQWYRVLTSMFLHWDINHLFNNMLTLCTVGTFLEKMIGRKWIIISYFVTGIIAGLVSLGYNMKLGQEVYSAGASGAIFGLIGVLLAVLILGKGNGEKISGKRLLVYIILVVWAQLSEKQVDNAAHIGGIVAGVLTGLVFRLKGLRMEKRQHEN